MKYDETDHQKIPLDQDELDLIEKVERLTKCFECSIIKNSSRKFDIDIEGETEDGILFYAWLPLEIIRSVDWTNDKIWSLTDAYGEKGYIPPQGFNWSGIRDSSKENVYKMLDAVLKNNMLDDV